MKTWNDIFDPVRKASGGLEARPQQEVLGNGVISALDEGIILLGNAPTGSGKSFATLVPAIDYVTRTKKSVVFSVTTLALQDQIAKKDLPFLSSIYKDFSWAILKGRGQYLCLNHMKAMTVGNAPLNEKFKKISIHSMATGERPEVEKLLGKLTDQEWAQMCGEAKRCGESKCTSTECYGAKAREKAQGKDIVVVNHSVLIADEESRRRSAMGGGFLGADGDYDVLIVDEAHELENSIISFLSEKINEWELNSWVSTIIKGIEECMVRGFYPVNERKAIEALDDLQEAFQYIIKFYYAISQNEGKDWDREVTKVTKKVVSVRAPQHLKEMGKNFEAEVTDKMFNALQSIGNLYIELSTGLKKAKNMEEERLRTLSKAVTKVNSLYSVMRKIFEACESSQGYSLEFGTPYGVLMDGYYNKKNEVKGSLIVTPLEVSEYARQMFEKKTCVFVSATLTDLSAPKGEEFEYFIKSMGIENREIDLLDLEAVFDYSSQQLVYISDPHYPIESNRVNGVKYSLKELEDLILAAEGRTLVLFTSNAELDEALGYLSTHNIPYPILAQGGSMSKQELVDEFMSQKDSVLLGSKSFFTGVDFHGEACSLVVLVKFPNPRFDDLCRLRINWWSKKGYRNWYEREALSVFQQGAGRLIRKGDDLGVVAVLDKRAVDTKERVHASVGKGVSAMGSSVTQDINDVKKFLGGKL